MSRKRDTPFLISAAIAGIAVVLAVAISAGLPRLVRAHGKPAEPVYVLLGAFGLAALAGCAANVYAHGKGRPPDKPRGGGRPAVHLRVVEGRARRAPAADQERPAA